MTDKELSGLRHKLQAAALEAEKMGNPMFSMQAIRHAAGLQFQITEELTRRELLRGQEVSQ